jgi:hypothetical protein
MILYRPGEIGFRHFFQYDVRLWMGSETARTELSKRLPISALQALVFFGADLIIQISFFRAVAHMLPHPGKAGKGISYALQILIQSDEFFLSSAGTSFSPGGPHAS